MSQSTVLAYLKQHSGWWSTREISEQLTQGIASTTTNLQKLRRTDMIKYKSDGIGYVYKYSRGE